MKIKKNEVNNFFYERELINRKLEQQPGLNFCYKCLLYKMIITSETERDRVKEKKRSENIIIKKESSFLYNCASFSL